MINDHPSIDGKSKSKANDQKLFKVLLANHALNG